jgi:PPM family protein phosphatase
MTEYAMKGTVEGIPAATLDNFLVKIYGISDIGCTKENNEDAIYFDSSEPLNNQRNKDYLLVIADGIEGHNGGEVASKLAVHHIYSARVRFGNDVHQSLTKAFIEANRAIYNTAQINSSLSGMGTTCTALLMRKEKVYCAHVGNSRAYLLRNASIYRMTEDHTVLEENRKKSKKEKSLNDLELESNLLTRALGIYSSVKVDTWSHGFPVRPKDLFLLCTDGLTDLVNDEDIKDVIMSYPLNEACHSLIKLAKQKGGYDNISIIALFVDSYKPPSRVRRI